MAKFIDDDDTDVEVLYEMPYATGNGNMHGNMNGNMNGNSKKNKTKRSSPTNANGGVIRNHVDFENVFDPYEREQDDVREFFDDSSEKYDDDSNDDWEQPTMFNDPRVREEYLFAGNFA